MKKSASLSVAHRIAELREDQALRQLAELQSRQEKAKMQLAELKGYHLEYQQQRQTLGRNGITGQILRQFTRFIRDLEHTIETQEQQVVFVEQQFKQATIAWQETCARREVMGKLVKRVQTQESVVREKTLEKEINDQAGYHFRGMRLDGGPDGKPEGR